MIVLMNRYKTFDIPLQKTYSDFSDFKYGFTIIYRALYTKKGKVIYNLILSSGWNYLYPQNI